MNFTNTDCVGHKMYSKMTSQMFNQVYEQVFNQVHQVKHLVRLQVSDQFKLIKIKIKQVIKK